MAMDRAMKPTSQMMKKTSHEVTLDRRPVCWISMASMVYTSTTTAYGVANKNHGLAISLCVSLTHIHTQTLSIQEPRVYVGTPIGSDMRGGNVDR